MVAYHWPGNVRELENAIQRAVILCDDDSAITQAHLAIEPKDEVDSMELSPDGDQTSLEDYFVRFVTEHQDQMTETELAEKLGISRKSLWERRQRLNIPRTKTKRRGPRRDSAQLSPQRIDRHPITPKKIDPNALDVVNRLVEHGYDAFLVGGCVRDLMCGARPKDFDVATSATPEEVSPYLSPGASRRPPISNRARALRPRRHRGVHLSAV